MVMPETKWEKLAPRVPIQRAEDFLHLVGGGWGAVQGRVEKADGTFHQPFPAGIPVAQPAGPPQERPPRPSETELRQHLAERVALAVEALAQHDAAITARARASEMRERCTAALTQYDGLDNEITRATVEALCDEAGRPDHLPPALDEKLSARDRARIDLGRAVAAEQVLTDEVASAKDRLTVREQGVHAAALPLLAIPAESIATEIREHEAAIHRLHAKLMGFDMLCAGFPQHMPGNVSDVLFNSGRIAAPEQVQPWADAAKQLRADPDWVVEIADPPEPPPKENLVIVPPWLQALRERDAVVRAEREAQAAREAEAAQVTDETTGPEAA
jgi:hypothetical protein